MPYNIQKVRGKNCYSVRVRSGKRKGKAVTRRVKSKCTTLAKARSQMRLLYALENPAFVPRRARK